MKPLPALAGATWWTKIPAVIRARRSNATALSVAALQSPLPLKQLDYAANRMFAASMQCSQRLRSAHHSHIRPHSRPWLPDGHEATAGGKGTGRAGMASVGDRCFKTPSFKAVTSYSVVSWPLKVSASYNTRPVGRWMTRSVRCGRSSVVPHSTPTAVQTSRLYSWTLTTVPEFRPRRNATASATASDRARVRKRSSSIPPFRRTKLLAPLASPGVTRSRDSNGPVHP